MTNEVKAVFDPTPQTVITLAATLANAANTTVTEVTQFNNALNYPYGKAVLSVNDTFAAAPTAGGTVDLYMVEDDIDGTNDETPIPAASDIIFLARWMGAWTVDNQDVAHIKPIRIDILGVVKARFFMANNTGQTISYTSVATTVKIQPFTLAPAA